MKFDDTICRILNESAEEDIFLDALSGSPKKKLVHEYINKLLSAIAGVELGNYPGFFSGIASKTAGKLLIMTKNDMLKLYILNELKEHNIDIIDLEYMAKYRIIAKKARKEERRKAGV